MIFRNCSSKLEEVSTIFFITYPKPMRVNGTSKMFLYSDFHAVTYVFIGLRRVLCIWNHRGFCKYSTLREIECNCS
jgi:hypothetical protein